MKTEWNKKLKTHSLLEVNKDANEEHQQGARELCNFLYDSGVEQGGMLIRGSGAKLPKNQTGEA